MNPGVHQVVTLVGMSVKRMTRERLSILLPVIIAIILGLACRFHKADLPLGVMLVGVVTGVTVARYSWIDKANHFADCMRSAGADRYVQTIAAVLVWVITTVSLGSVVFLLASAH